jgi:hypothetical protein
MFILEERPDSGERPSRLSEAQPGVTPDAASSHQQQNMERSRRPDASTNKETAETYQ